MTDSEPTLSTSVAVLIDRLVERILPDTAKWSKNPSFLVRYGATFLGGLTWAGVMGLFVLPREGSLILNSVIFVDLTGSLWFSLSLLIVLLAIKFTILIGASVRRGTSLNYYLWGLAIPTVVVNILAFAHGVIFK